MGSRLAPRVGKVVSERIYKPIKPASDQLTKIAVVPENANQQSLDKVQPPTPTLQKPVAAKKPLSVSKSSPAKLDSPIRPVANTNQKQVSAPADPPKPATAASPETNLQLPTVVVRPSVAQLNQQNECVVEINQIRSTNDVSLKVSIPDSVTMIEVVPTGGSNTKRSFRIKMEQGVEKEEELQQAPLPQHRPQHQSQLAQSSSANLTPSVAFEEVPHHYRPDFTRNPFFEKRQVSRSAIDATRDQPVLVTSPLPTQTYANENAGVRGFLQRTSHASVSEESSQNQHHRTDLEQSNNSSDHWQNLLPTSPIVAAQVVGPAKIAVGQTADYMIALLNPMNSINRDLRIELDVPKGLEVVVLDRDADYNERTRTLLWRVSEIHPGEEIRIKYRVKSLRKGRQLQRVVVRANEDLLERHEKITLASLDLDAGVAELPYD